MKPTQNIVLQSAASDSDFNGEENNVKEVDSNIKINIIANIFDKRWEKENLL
jgi:hypothetical protein